MGSHRDSDHDELRVKLLDELRIRAEVMTELGKNTEATRAVLEQWNYDDIEISRKEDDRNGVLRISIGGRPNVARSEYCNFRGDHNQCIALLERVLQGMKQR